MRMSTTKAGASSSHPREFAIAGGFLVGVGALWLLLGGAAAVWFFSFVSVKPDTNVVGADVIYRARFTGLAIVSTLPSIIVLAIGLALRAPSVWGAAVAFAASAVAFAEVTWTVARLPGVLQPWGFALWPAGLVALALSGSLVLLIAQGFMSPTIAPTTVPPESRRRIVVRALARSPVQTGLLFGIALVFVAFFQAERAIALRSSTSDEGPLSLRSDLSLALQATSSPQLTAESARGELLRRGATSVPAVVSALGACPMRFMELNQRSARRGVDEPCTDWRVPALFDLLADLGGPTAIAELLRWTRAAQADPVLRDQAGGALGRAGDRESIGDIAALLDVPDPPSSYGGPVRRRLDLVVGALVKLHASNQIPHIASALLRLGPAASFATAGLRALGDFDAEEGWGAFLEIARSSDPAWRRNALGAYSRMDRLPPQVAAFCLQELDDEDRDARGYACTDLMGSTYDSGRQRYPALYALLGNPCTDPMRVELIRDAVEGRPLPSPAALGRPTLGPRPYLAPGLYADPSASPSVRQQLMFGPRLHLAPGLYGGRNIAPPGAVVPPAPTQP